MAKKPNEIDVLDRFCSKYINGLEGPTDMGRILMNLIADDLTDLERLRNYLVIEEYYTLLRENNGISYITLIQLADKYDLNEKQVQNIIYKWSDKYKKANNVVSTT